MSRVASVMLAIAGAIHLVPITGALGAARLEALYGVPVTNATMELLLQHRALQLGFLGALLLWAAFRAALQPVAIVAGVASAASFVVLAAASDHGVAIDRVIVADLVALGCLVVAGIARRHRR